jgi:transposase-like protein
MPWKECSVMDERLRFVGRLLDGEAMTDVCREFGISRKTGYKIFDRYKSGLLGLLGAAPGNLRLGGSDWWGHKDSNLGPAD